MLGEKQTSFSFLKFIPIILGIVALYPVCFNGWVNWDDPKYILDNPLVGELTWERIRLNFSSFTIGAYHPLTTLSYCLDYTVDGFNARVFHFMNFLLHLVNVYLVYEFLKRLTLSTRIGFIASVLFAIHPMNVEAVAWVTGRKDLLMATFTLLGLIFYLKNHALKSKKALLIPLLFFVMAVLSKGTAIIFPVLLILIDFYKKEKITLSSILLKTPFILISIGFGLVAKYGQHSAVGMKLLSDIDFGDSFFIGVYNFWFYIIKCVLPTQLSPLHPYPHGIALEGVPMSLKITIIPFLGLLYFWVNKLRFNNNVNFVVVFYGVSSFLILQFIPFGQAMEAERFFYFPGIGLILGIGFFVVWFEKRFEKFKKAIYGMLLILVGCLVVLSHQQSKVWKDSKSMWEAVIVTYPENEMAYNNLAFHMAEKGDYNASIDLLNEAFKYTQDKYSPLNNIGLMYAKKGNDSLALQYFNESIIINDSIEGPRENRALLLIKYKRYQEAYSDLKVIRKLNSVNPYLLYGEGIILLEVNQSERAIGKLDSALILGCKSAPLYFYLGKNYMSLKQFAKAKGFLTKAINKNVRIGMSHYLRSQCFYLEKNYSRAREDFEKAIKNGVVADEEYARLILNGG